MNMFQRRKNSVTNLQHVSDTQTNVQIVVPKDNLEKEQIVSPKNLVTHIQVDTARRNVLDLPGIVRRYDHSLEPYESKRLVVGRGIELIGAITACDRLTVEGRVSADLNNAGLIEVSHTGIFRGTAEVDTADISGLFEGTLVVRRKLIIRSTGRVRGTVSYTHVIIELGGEIQGTVNVLAKENIPVVQKGTETSVQESIETTSQESIETSVPV